MRQALHVCRELFGPVVQLIELDHGRPLKPQMSEIDRQRREPLRDIVMQLLRNPLSLTLLSDQQLAGQVLKSLLLSTQLLLLLKQHGVDLLELARSLLYTPLQLCVRLSQSVLYLYKSCNTTPLRNNLCDCSGLIYDWRQREVDLLDRSVLGAMLSPQSYKFPRRRLPDAGLYLLLKLKRYIPPGRFLKWLLHHVRKP